MGHEAHDRIFAAELLATTTDKRPPELIASVARQTRHLFEAGVYSPEECAAVNAGHVLGYQGGQ